MLSRLTCAALVVTAVLALTATSAAAEQAKFTAPSYPAVINSTSVGKNTFKFGTSWEVGCEKTTFSEWNLTGPTEGAQFNPAYSGCVATGSRPATVRLNGCVYAWKLETLEPEGTATARTSGSCGEGKVIEIDIYESAFKHSLGTPLCTYGIPPQVTTGMKTHNRLSGGVEVIEVTLTTTGFEVKVLKGTKAICGAAVGETITGTFTGTQTASATIEGKAVNLMVG